VLDALMFVTMTIHIRSKQPVHLTYMSTDVVCDCNGEWDQKI